MRVSEAETYQRLRSHVAALKPTAAAEALTAVLDNSLESLANLLGNRFWADLEAHHPGICSLHLPEEVARCWKQRLQTTMQGLQRRSPGALASTAW